MAGRRYSKYEPTLDDLDMSDLMNMIKDRLMESGFNRNPWDPDPDYQQSMQDLYDSIAEALVNNDLVSDQIVEDAMNSLEQNGDWMDSQLGEMVNDLAQRLEQEGYLKPQGGEDNNELNGQGGMGSNTPRDAKFELTNKAVDFLGYKTLRDVLGGAGKSSIGSHETKFQTTGVETTAESKPYEFGDTMNLDVSQTFKNAAARGISDDGKFDLDYGDLAVMQAEYNSSAATVVMLDCSHSMILYGEDRFTPAKQVALALAHMIQSQFRGDSIRFLLFHNSAEEISLKDLATCQVGPYHTNTAEGLKLAQKILKRQNKDMKQIILDPMVLGETLREVGSCRRQGIQINTFMLARDPELIAFVQRVSHMTKGKAYFTTPHTIGQYVLQDFQNRRTKMVN